MGKREGKGDGELSVGDPTLVKETEKEEVGLPTSPREEKPKMWVSPRMKEHRALVSASIGILGPSGAGKTELLKQLAEDEEYRGRVVVYYAENPTATIGDELIESEAIIPIPVSGGWDLLKELQLLEEAKKRGEVMPLVIGIDSISGIGDKEMIQSYNDPNRFPTKKGEENHFRKYMDLGMVVKQVQIICRDHLGIDCIILATTTPRKPGQPPELCVDGNIVPENFTRLTNFTFYLEPKTKDYGGFETKEAALGAVESARHRTFGAIQLNDGSWTVRVTDRFFSTVNTGEVQAKGSSKLELEEKANLPEILRKIHGRQKGK